MAPRKVPSSSPGPNPADSNGPPAPQPPSAEPPPVEEGARLRQAVAALLEEAQ